MNDQRIIAQLEFENAYKEYTEASNTLFNARIDIEKQEAREKFEKASERFNLAYKRLKDIRNDS
ncbi:MAG: hypothetical protein IJ220_08610 [Clostridia bacterium]|nr:hypothetical protein [Clostridia bacterium]